MTSMPTRLRTGAAALLTVAAFATAAESQTIDFLNGAIVNGPIVRNAPYSAEGITTVTQVLADGTRIERRVTARIFRDGAGRVRREQTVLGLAALTPSSESQGLITIVDPVAGASYVLSPSTHMGRRTPLPASGSSGAYAREVHDRLAARGASAPSGGNPRPAPTSGPPPPLPPPPPPPPAPPGGDIRPMPAGGPVRAATSEESLGTKQIDGLVAIGRLTRTTIPVGQIGNDRPIEMTDERWESVDLKVLVLSRHHDPRTGDVEYQLTNVTRAEPPAHLFSVPADFTIVGKE